MHTCYTITQLALTEKTLDIHLHARHIYLGITKLYVTGYPTVPSFYPTPPPTFFKDFRGFPGISPDILFPYHPNIKTFNKINKIYLPYFEIPCDLKHTFFRLKYSEPCPYINSHSSCTALQLHPAFTKIFGIYSHSVHSTIPCVYT